MPNPVSTIERLPDESAKAYRARVEYVTMGPDRSLDKLRQKYNRNTSYKRQLGVWSSRYDWQATAEGWDNQQAAALEARRSAQYLADFEAHRKSAMDSSKNLKVLAGRLAQIMADALQQPKEIKGADGRTYKLHSIDINTSTLTTISKALTTALDLEAHALGLDVLLPSLMSDDSE
jgi:hypothetical protein